MNFANIRNEQIIDFNSQYLDADITRVEVSDEIYQAYLEDRNKVIYQDGEIISNPNYEEEQEAKERERIQELFMTRSDFFDGTIDAWGIGEDELLLVIKQVLDLLPFDEKTERKALNNFKNALNFYRKHTLFSLLVDNPIKLTDTIQVTLTDEALDKYFDEVNKGNKDTAWQYLPQPVAIPLPEEPEHIEDNLDMVEPEVEQEGDDEYTEDTTVQSDISVQPQDEDGLQEGQTEN